VGDTRLFGVSILTEDQGEIAERFAKPSEDKFAGLAVVETNTGLPLLSDALARLECRVVEEVAGGTHSVFLAEVLRAEAGSGLPLTYYRGRFGRLEQTEDDVAYDELRRRVLEGRFGEGDRLEVDELAAELGTQPWHVYHALTRLTADGFVVRDLDVGYTIAPVDLRTLEDALDGRRAIEVGAVELSIGRTTPEELAELRRRMERTLPLIANGRFVDVHEYAAANAAFHEYFVGLAGSTALVDAHHRVNTAAMILSVTGARAVGQDGYEVAARSAYKHHVRLLEAYEAGDLAAAMETINHHIDTAVTFTRRHMEAVGGAV